MMGSSSDIDVSIASLYKAWRAFRRGKRASGAVCQFEYDLEKNLLELALDLRNDRYKHGSYRFFEVSDNKRRHIAVAEVRDRVVHRLVYGYLVGVYDKRFCYDAWSCRRGKGLHGAISRVQLNMRRYRDGWLWRSDIDKFFDNVNQEVLLGLLRDVLSESRAFSLLREIISSYNGLDSQTDRQAQTQTGVCARRGLAIGNLTSQILANVYLNEFDRYMLHDLKPLGYVRYGDDFVSWWCDAPSARSAAASGEKFLRENLKLHLNQKVYQLSPAKYKLHMLGREFWPSGNRLDGRMRGRIKQRLSVENYASYRAMMGNGRRKLPPTIDFLQ